MKNYLQLEKEIESIFQINNAIEILYWDIATYMPTGSADSREKDIANLTIIANKMLKSARISDLLQGTKEEIPQLDKWQLANIREIERRRIREINFIEDTLQRRYISATTKCELIWRQARQDDDYHKLQPYLQEVLNCVKEIATIKANNLGCSKYDALADIYDPERKTSEIKEIYSAIKSEIPPLIQQIIDKQKTESVIPITNNVNPEKQRIICKKIAEILGFDLTRGRLDESVHPGCYGTPHDSRLTNRYNSNLVSAIMGIIHETGHGLYEQNLPEKYKNQPVGQPKGMAIHESQSLFMEMQVGTSREFIEYLAKLLKDDFSLNSQEYSSENLYKIVTRVKPNFIRVDADEVTYLIHNMLRFEIEEGLINDQLTLEELPHIWNNKMDEYLHIIPTSNKEGCLQDIQWNSGHFGYFPAYANGVIIASMLMNKVQALYPRTKQEILLGNFTNLNGFLNENIRNFGSLKSSNDLIKDATGDIKIDPNIFINYLKQKYLY